VVPPADTGSVSETGFPPESTAQATTPQMTFQEHLAMQRHRKDLDPTLP
jgi:hypothetical protein